MRSGAALVVIIVVAFTCQSFVEPERVYLNEWAVEVKGGESVARNVASDHGLHYIRRIGSLKDKYHLSRGAEVVRSKRAADDVTELLMEDERVLWVSQQPETMLGRRSGNFVPPDVTGDDYDISFNDPKWPKQWYLHNDGQQGAVPGVDMNLVPAWKLGFTGKGVVVTVVDDGMDYTHPDLSPNFDKDASFDFNNKSKTADIDPRPNDSKEAGMENAHGTRCAGEIAAVANNGICGVGAAYEASIGGLRILDGGVTDAMQASAVLFNNSHIDIYSCCWGPPDDGKTFQKPGELLTQALEKGANEGRNGKGSIFVWASGNGGAQDDDCSADAYVGNIHTISIGSANDKGQSVYFMEKCPSTLAVTLSGGPHKAYTDFNMNEVTTTDLHNGCTSKFIGTSSAAPLASGILALVLQANPSLTWRDVQHIIVHGSHIPNPMEGGWHINGAGYHLNHRFGFGVLDAGKMVKLALTWENVPEQQTCKTPVTEYNIEAAQGETKTIFIKVENCHNIKQLEHTQAHITFQSPRRGDISIMLYSPSGTPSELLSTRKYDSDFNGISNWPFMTVHNWGENPQGIWTLEFTYNETPKDIDDPPDVMPRKKSKAVLVSVGLTFYGIREIEVNDNKENVDPNPAINPQHAGKSNQNTVVDIYNDEQLHNEEIVLDVNDISGAAKLPPNKDHNLDEDGDLIDTGNFDGVLLGASQNIILDENFLDSLDVKELKVLLREVVLEEKVLELERMLEGQRSKRSPPGQG
ncbi:PC3-like endoprotease variant B [Anneissia japonica]|uniref:PC3-like endoprotease variant B n=1 Tax=Anneissia japonica TaxID=1529436 RepID=UPI001425792E|nr:PC3-like endoprotease variant B [Anneissia japonica]XP_033095687.1 PC3-like endoprotease variant B [Anneissia japonica]